MSKENIKGHSAAAITILIWGTTFISTKILLREFNAAQILFFRFIIGFIALMIVFPRRMKLSERKHELTFAAAGLCGVTLYYMLENMALVYSTASNVGVIISAAPFFTVIISRFLFKEERLTAYFFAGFVTAMTGIAMISFNGNNSFRLNPLGDILALLAAVIWAFYSVLTRKIGNYGYNTIQATRRTFFYGIIFMIPLMFVFDFKFGFECLCNVKNLLNIAFLGLGASALCFVTWNTAVKKLGAVQTSIYIYAVPVITLITSIVVLKEPFTLITAAGTALTLIGLLISQRR